MGTCDECGEPFGVSPLGTTFHTDEAGGRDFDADADHVPYEAEPDALEVTYTVELRYSDLRPDEPIATEDDVRAAILAGLPGGVSPDSVRVVRS